MVKITHHYRWGSEFEGSEVDIVELFGLKLIGWVRLDLDLTPPVG